MRRTRITPAKTVENREGASEELLPTCCMLVITDVAFRVIFFKEDLKASVLNSRLLPPSSEPPDRTTRLLLLLDNKLRRCASLRKVRWLAEENCLEITWPSSTNILCLKSCCRCLYAECRNSRRTSSTSPWVPAKARVALTVSFLCVNRSSTQGYCIYSQLKTWRAYVALHVVSAHSCSSCPAVFL